MEWLKLASKDNATEDEKASVGEYSHRAAIVCSVCTTGEYSMIDEIMEQRRSARSKVLPPALLDYES